ncbi:MAG: FAD-dependent oxidoreductase [Oscillospiraceae bacterium]|nr:FAD-dependent oxidoreductase [Oscillospiraceae bacterium]
MRCELVVIGAGPAGLAAACAAAQSGIQKILIIERDMEAGGILNQCIHNGFGLHRFKEELTGPEYAKRYIDLTNETSAELMLDTMVLSVDGTTVTAVSRQCGLMSIEAGAVVLAMGCRERTRGAISIPGTRPAGVFTAGCAQRYVNIEGKMVGRRVVILGSGDIGLIMARRLTLEGAQVLACVEVMPYSGGLARNIAQCLNDFDIPLYLSHTVTDVRGAGRVEGVTVMRVDEDRRPVPGTEMEFDCDTLLLSVGLIPETELAKGAGIEIDRRTNGPAVYENMETSQRGVFACGNVVHVHDLVDFVSAEGERAGKAAAAYIQGKSVGARALDVSNGAHVTYTVPQKIRPENVEGFVELSFRVNAVLPKADVVVCCGGAEILRKARAHMAPGEMQKLVVAAKQLTGDLTVSAEETR